MEKLASSWFDVQSVPESYIFPPERRPGKHIFPLCKTIPIIDLGKLEGTDRSNISQQILEASQKFGFFQVINHGVSENLLLDAMKIFKEFFNMAAEDKANGPNKGGWVYTNSISYAKEGVHLWRENLKIPCHPLEECMQFWPEKPTRYMEVVGTYVLEVRKLSLRILELISEGLGLESGYFKESSEIQLLSANHYPPCPDPSLTLGILRHFDPSLITILYQGDVCGLQVFKDEQWIGIEALPNAFAVNIGNQLQIISNGKLKSAEHRVVTNSSEARTSIATFINPTSNCIVEPAKSLVNAMNPPLYEAFMYKKFVNSSKAFGDDTDAIQNILSSVIQCMKGT
ncbi:hyoscyamine 6-dioxygenase-like [Cornus florida]|uniref:hyoscyamine 6-dioxygenase-like n=1 Tax=Cornus florida TaxID=4283 RepID=UPI00289B6857|nr:hyoscyamine 6-dioxygenase-like [Cornus florida]